MRELPTSYPAVRSDIRKEKFLEMFTLINGNHHR